MTSVDDIRELLAQLAVNTVETQTQINALAAEVRGLAVNVGAAPGGAAPPVLALQSATQTGFENHLKQLCTYHCQMTNTTAGINEL